MMDEMYDLNTNDHTIEIDGFPFFIEEFTPVESFNRREINSTSIKSGTEFQERGKYIPRQFSFTTSVEVPLERPHIHDKIFQKLSSKPCEIITPYMSDIFKGSVIIKKGIETPTKLKLEINVKEIPETESNIPDEQ